MEADRKGLSSVRFKEFINEIEITRGVGSLKSLGDDYDQLKTWVNGFAPKFFKLQKPIFRGVLTHAGAKSAMGIYNTRTMYRPPKQGFGYYNLWIDNEPEWRNFPKRAKSLICTTSSENATDFGRLHYVIPRDNTPIGICPSDDIWFSFDKTRMLSTDGALFMAMKYLANLTQTDDEHWDKFKEACMNVTLSTIEERVKTRQYDFFYNDLALKANFNRANLFYILKQVFSPTDFKVLEAQHFDKANITRAEPRELWMSGDVAMVDPETYEKLQDDLL